MTGGSGRNAILAAAPALPRTVAGAVPLMQSVLDRLPSAIVVFDAAGVVVMANARAQALPEPVLWKRLVDLPPVQLALEKCRDEGGRISLQLGGDAAVGCLRLDIEPLGAHLLLTATGAMPELRAVNEELLCAYEAMETRSEEAQAAGELQAMLSDQLLQANMALLDMNRKLAARLAEFERERGQ